MYTFIYVVFLFVNIYVYLHAFGVTLLGESHARPHLFVLGGSAHAH